MNTNRQQPAYLNLAERSSGSGVLYTRKHCANSTKFREIWRGKGGKIQNKLKYKDRLQNEAEIGRVHRPV